MTFTIETIDPEQQTIIDLYLAESGYADLEAWGLDSDYVYDDEQDEWFDGNVIFINDIRATSPLGSMVDLRVQLLAALGQI